MINARHGGRRHRYAYASTGVEGWFLFDGLVKHDLDTGADERYRYGTGVFGSEAAVAPKTTATGEDDAYLVTLTTDIAANRSECLVFDARRVADGPVCRISVWTLSSMNFADPRMMPPRQRPWPSMCLVAE